MGSELRRQLGKRRSRQVMRLDLRLFQGAQPEVHKPATVFQQPFCACLQVHFHAPNLVVATGQNSVPWEPQLPGRSQFRGTVMHSFDYKNPAPFKVRLAASFTARYMVQGVSFCAASARERRQCQLVRPHDSTGKRTTHVIKAACRLLSRNTQSAGQTT